MRGVRRRRRRVDSSKERLQQRKEEFVALEWSPRSKSCTAARSQDAPDFAQRPLQIDEEHSSHAARNCVKRIVIKWKFFSVTRRERNVGKALLLGVLARDF